MDEYENPVCQYNAGCPQCTAEGCGHQFTVGGTTYYCIYDGGEWKWSTSKPDNFCCSDSECPVDNDPNSDTYGVKGRCDCPESNCTYPAPPLGKDDYTCKWQSCRSSLDCDANLCCEWDIKEDANNDGDYDDCVDIGSISESKVYLCAS